MEALKKIFVSPILEWKHWLKEKFCNIDTHYLFSIFHVDARHSVAIADMGNYQEVLRQLSPLREVDPGQNRVHMFGNPFKLAKDQVSVL